MDIDNNATGLPVVFASDRRYVLPLMVAMYSLYRNQNQNTKIQTYVIETGDIPEYCKTLMDSMANHFKMPKPEFIAPMSDYEALDMRIAHTTQATYYRLDLPDLLPQTAVCLYLDCDLLVTSDISSLFAIDMSESLLAGVKAAAYYYPVDHQAHKATMLGISALDQYVNAGVLLMNLERMRAEGLAERFKLLLGENFRAQDQDILNAACYGEIKTIAPAFNLMAKYHPGNPGSFEDDPCIAMAWTREEWEQAAACPIIFHYADDVKPWDSFRSDGSERWWATVSEMEGHGFIPLLHECLLPAMGTCDNLRAKTKEAISSAVDFKDAYHSMRNDYAAVKDECTHLREWVNDLKAAATELNKREQELESALEAMRSSRAWKIGRALTAPARALKSVLSSSESQN